MAEENEDLSEEGEVKSKKKLYLIIGIVVLMLLFSATAVFFMLGDDAAEDGTAEQTEVEEEDDEEKVASYFEMEPEFKISLPPGSRFRQAQIGVQIFTYSPSLLDYIRKNHPMLRHHLLNLMNEQDGNALAERDGREKLQAALKDKLVELISASADPEESRLGKKVEQVYFTSFVLQ
ncbi:MAG: flagellar basal body-associated FliL family protein [Chromatiales bacterium]|jgi:flagellar FliL protein